MGREIGQYWRWTPVAIRKAVARIHINPYAHERCPWCDGGGLSREAKAVSDKLVRLRPHGPHGDAITDDEVASRR